MSRQPPTSMRVPAAALVLALAGCSALSPHMYSSRRVAVQDANGKWALQDGGAPRSLEETYAAAALMQGRYLAAVESQGNAVPQISAGLLGLSASSLYKGITGPNTRDMAGAGVVGTSAWAWRNTMLSDQRLAVYRAGADALGCAMAAVEPLRSAEKRLGNEADGAQQDTLYGRYQAVVAAQRLLRIEMVHSVGLTASRLVSVPAPAPAPRPPICKPVAVSAPALDKLALERCKAQPPSPPPAAAPSTVTELPPTDLAQAYAQAKTVFQASGPRLQQAERVIDAVSGAGPALWQRTLAIENAVSTEVDKTIPNPASVLAAAKGMKDVAGVITGASVFKTVPAPGEAQGAAKRREETGQDRAATARLQQASTNLELAQIELDGVMLRLAGKGTADARARLAECQLRISGVTLNVSPSGEVIPAPLGAATTFFVSGGSGVPLGAVRNGPKPGPLPLKVEGGLFRFEFTPPDGVAVDTVLTLRFTDGAGQAEKLVEVQVTAAAPAAAAPAAAAAKCERKRVGLLGSDNLALLKLTPEACDDDIDKAVAKCQASATPGSPVATQPTPDNAIKALGSQPAACTL